MNQQSKRNLTNKIISLAGIMVFVFFISNLCQYMFKLSEKEIETRRKLFGGDLYDDE